MRLLPLDETFFELFPGRHVPNCGLPSGAASNRSRWPRSNREPVVQLRASRIAATTWLTSWRRSASGMVKFKVKRRRQFADDVYLRRQTNEVSRSQGLRISAAAPGRPICAFLKNTQAKLLQSEVDAGPRLCNLHMWGVAAVRSTAAAAKLFISLLEEQTEYPACECSFCMCLAEEEFIRLKELAGSFYSRCFVRQRRNLENPDHR